jgi:hypothetical protein
MGKNFAQRDRSGSERECYAENPPSGAKEAAEKLESLGENIG